MKIEICIGTTCHLMGGSYLEELVQKYKNKEGIKFRYVTCFDVCSGVIPAPVVKIDGEFHGDMTSEKLDEIIVNFLATVESGEK